jgi:hypothetical protein
VSSTCSGCRCQRVAAPSPQKAVGLLVIGSLSLRVGGRACRDERGAAAAVAGLFGGLLHQLAAANVWVIGRYTVQNGLFMAVCWSACFALLLVRWGELASWAAKTAAAGAEQAPEAAASAWAVGDVLAWAARHPQLAAGQPLLGQRLLAEEVDGAALLGYTSREVRECSPGLP